MTAADPAGHTATQSAEFSVVQSAAQRSEAMPLAAAASTPGKLSGTPAAGNAAAPLRSVLDWSPTEIVKAIPELKGFQPAASQDDLASTLQKVGDKVDGFLRDFPNTTCVEEIRQQRFDDEGPPPAGIAGMPYIDERGKTKLGYEEELGGSLARTFRYLALLPQDKTFVGLVEYRTDSKGRIVEPERVPGTEQMVTRGFVSMPLVFHPHYRAGSDFRYLGRQALNKSDAHVIAFVQRPDASALSGRVTFESRSASVLFQGVAWIDFASFQVLAMRTWLVEPQALLGLASLNTEVSFAEVSFKKDSLRVWLPQEVVVALQRRGKTLRNRHRYSHYKLFTVEAEERR